VQRTDLHRSTVCVHLNELVRLGFIERSVVVGTENKNYPTYLYQLSSEAKQREISVFLERVKIADELLPQQSDFLPKEHGFEKNLEKVLIKMAKEIVLLRNRVAQLEAMLGEQCE
jgi:hypothetical protein